MIEFGSDFHYIDSYNSGGTSLADVFRGATLLADGRQCIVALVRQYKWRRIWMPEYFCYEVIDHIKRNTDIEIVFYQDFPGHDEKSMLERLPYREGDVLFRMNYFGLRDKRDNSNICVPVIEDHSHDLTSIWAQESNADWCIASLRKSLPIPEGGMMWSPKGYSFLLNVKLTEENRKTANIRWNAMKKKSAYLLGASIRKEDFRKQYTMTEEWFDHADLSLIDKRSRKFIMQFDLGNWNKAKRDNWHLLKDIINKSYLYKPEADSCTPFQWVILLDSNNQRDIVRQKLITKDVYPSILWVVPKTVSREVKDISGRILCIHCDGRYQKSIAILAKILNETLS